MTKRCVLFVFLTLVVSLSLAEEPIIPPIPPIRVELDALVPTLSALSPANVTAGSAGLTLRVSGLNFCPKCVVLWNGAQRPTQVVSSVSATVTLSASDLAQAGRNSVLMLNTLKAAKVAANVT